MVSFAGESMGTIHILKLGSTLPWLVPRLGDFEDWILSGMQLAPGAATVVDVAGGSALPAYRYVSGAVVSGSHAAVTEHRDWSERTAEWLAGAVARQIPILGICYGHQLLAYALGGEVGDNPRGREFGTLPVYLDGAAACDPLLGGLTSPMGVHLCHNQSVLRLPAGARFLAWSDLDRNQAFVVGDAAWGVQFHPEFSAAAVAAYVDDAREELAAAGRDPDVAMASCEDTLYGAAILRRFVAVVQGRGQRGR
jgi:GMP synthase (glutamine-hydrolysing)